MSGVAPVASAAVASPLGAPRSLPAWLRNKPPALAQAAQGPEPRLPSPPPAPAQRCDAACAVVSHRPALSVSSPRSPPPLGRAPPPPPGVPASSPPMAILQPPRCAGALSAVPASWAPPSSMPLAASLSSPSPSPPSSSASPAASSSRLQWSPASSYRCPSAGRALLASSSSPRQSALLAQYRLSPSGSPTPPPAFAGKALPAAARLQQQEQQQEGALGPGHHQQRSSAPAPRSAALEHAAARSTSSAIIVPPPPLHGDDGDDGDDIGPPATPPPPLVAAQQGEARGKEFPWNLTVANGLREWEAAWTGCLRDLLAMLELDAEQREHMADVVLDNINPMLASSKSFPSIVAQAEELRDKAAGADEKEKSDHALRERVYAALKELLATLGVHNIYVVFFFSKLDCPAVLAGAVPERAAAVAGRLSRYLVFERALRALVRLQARVRGVLARRLRERLRAVWVPGRNVPFLELLRGEREVCAQLAKATKEIYAELREAVGTPERAKGKAALADEDLALVYGDAHKLYALHYRVRCALEALMPAWPALGDVGRVFLALAPHFRLLVEYARSAEVQQEAIARLMRDCPQFTRATDVEELGALLAAPLRHWPLYQTCLERMCHATPAETPAGAALSAASSLVGEVMKFIRSSGAVARQRALMAGAVARLGGPGAVRALLGSNAERSLLLECDAELVVRKKASRRRLFVFSDRLVLGEPSKDGSRCKPRETFDLADFSSAALDAQGAAVELAGEQRALQLRGADAAETRRVLAAVAGVIEGRGSTNRLFGQRLGDVVARDGSRDGVPVFLRVSFDWLLRHVGTVGLFRVSPEAAALKRMQARLERAPEVAYDEGEDAILVAAAVKSFLREMPEPLLTSSLYPRFLALDASDAGTARRGEFVASVAELLAQMPAVHRATTRALLGFLVCVVEASGANRMTPSNLSIAESVDSIMEIPTANNVVAGVFAVARELLGLPSW
eukprot:m51a1_g8956 hypothetical protein (971) ;mRNA; f:1039133-1042458